MFGLVDTQFQPARGYMEVVARRNRATLTNVINRTLRANSVIHSDEWRAYINLPQHVPNCIAHDTVNHTYNFVNPQTGAHTQVFNNIWCSMSQFSFRSNKNHTFLTFVDGFFYSHLCFETATSLT